MSEKAATLFEQFSRMCEKADGIEMEVWFAHRDSVRVAIDQLQAENKRLRGLLERAFAWVYILRRDKTIYESGALDKLEEECGNVVQEQLDSASKETI